MGANTSCTVQVALTAMVWPAQVSVSVNGPVMAGVPNVTGALPVLVTVSVCAADCVPSCCAAKLKLVAESVMAGCASEIAVSRGVCHRPRP